MVEVLRVRGHVRDSDVAAVNAADFDDGQVVEMAQHVAVTVWANFLNEISEADIDFPIVMPDQSRLG